MSMAALSWAFEQEVGWPLAKLLLIKIGDECSPLEWELEYDLDGLLAFSGAHSQQEVAGALNYLAAKRLVHLCWYAPAEIRPDVPFGVRTCDPECFQCVQKPKPVPVPPWVLLRREWERIRAGIMPVLFERDGAVCRNCGAVEALTGDHVVALRRGGTNDLANLQVLCLPCNTRKGVGDS